MPAVELKAAGLAGETRGAGLEDIDLGLAITAYLKAEGIDVLRAVADIGYEREHKAQRAREAAARSEDIALELRKAKRALLFEQQGYLEHSPGFGIGRVGEASQRVDQLTAALSETLGHDRS